MAKTGRRSWVSILTYTISIALIGLLVWLVTWQPSPEVAAQKITTVENRTVQERLEVSGLTITQVIDDNEQKVLQLFVDEYTIADLQVDQTIDLSVTALDYEGTGKIHSLADQPRLTGDTTEYEMIVQFDEEPAELRNGMHANVTVVLTSAENVLAVLNDSIYKIQNEYFVDRVTKERRVELPRLGIEQTDLDTTPIAVELGVEGNDYTEIISGLNVGDKVIVH